MKVRGALLCLFLSLLFLVTSSQGMDSQPSRKVDDNLIHSFTGLVERWRTSSSVHADWWKRPVPRAEEPAEELALIEDRVKWIEAKLLSLEENLEKIKEKPLPKPALFLQSLSDEDLKNHFPNAANRVQQTDRSLQILEARVSNIEKVLGRNVLDQSSIYFLLLEEANSLLFWKRKGFEEAFLKDGVVKEIPEWARQFALKCLSLVKKVGPTFAQANLDLYLIRDQLQDSQMGLRHALTRIERTHALASGPKSKTYRDVIWLLFNLDQKSLLEQDWDFKLHNDQPAEMSEWRKAIKNRLHLDEADFEAIVNGEWHGAKYSILQDLASEYNRVLQDVEQSSESGQASSSGVKDLNDKLAKFHFD